MKLGIGTYAYAWSIGTVTGEAPAKPMDAKGLGVELVQIADNLPPATVVYIGDGQFFQLSTSRRPNRAADGDDLTI